MANRQNKNVCGIQSTASYVGLFVEHSHIKKLHADEFYDSQDLNVFEMVYNLKTELEDLKSQVVELREQVRTMKLSQLSDVDVSNVADGNILSYDNSKWVPVSTEN